MYKVFGIEQIGVLNDGRWAGTSETVRRSNDGTQFITQLKTGVEPKEDDKPLLNGDEARELMDTSDWKKETEI